MLVLWRKKKEYITIGDNIKVVLLDSNKAGARIGIEAPPEINIARSKDLPTPLERTDE